MRTKILLPLLLLATSVWGQTRLPQTQQDEVIRKVEKNAASMQTIVSPFIQTKTMKMLSRQMKMSGVMYFKRTSKLRWQYTAPYDYTFVLNGDKAKLCSKRSAKNIDMKGNKMFREISHIIINTFTGGSINQQRDFTVELFRQGGNVFARLHPKKKEMKQIFQEVELWFNPALTMVSSVRMTERTGDVTLIRFTNFKSNVPINEKLFSVR